ncbi:MAG: RND family transporter [Gammaproteobacteria bacterium]|nr:MAG: RND family transporter [Gammaproteobacteria bacterium]
MKRFWLDTILLRPWLSLLIGILLVGAAGYGAKNLYFRGDYKIYFDKDFPQLIAYEKMQNVFNKNENVAIIVAPKDGNVFTRETLTFIKTLTDEAWQTPFSSRVDSIANYQHTEAEEDDLIVEDLILDAADLDDEKIAKVREIALNEPLLVGRLVSDRGHVAVVNVTVQLPEEDKTAKIMKIVAFTKDLTARLQQQYPDIDIYHAGTVLMNYSFASEAQRDGETLIPLMFLAIVIMLILMMKSFTGTFGTVFIIVLSVVATMGLTGWAGIFLSTATVNAPTIIMTLAVADCVHLISTMLFRMSRGESKADALRHAMQINLVPIFITSATTAIGFLTMNFSDVPVLRDLGNVTALGVMLAFAFTVTLLPALLMILPVRVKHVEQRSTRMEAFGDWVIRHRRVLMPAMAILMVVFASFITLNKVNDEAVKYFAKHTEFRQSVDFMQDNVSGMGRMDFAIYTGQTSGINNPDVLSKLDAFARWLESQPEVDHVDTITHTFKRLNKNMHGDDPAYYRLPENQELAAQYLLMYEMSLPYGLDLNNQLNIDKSSVRLVATMKNLGSKEFTAFEARAYDWFREHAPDLKMEAASPSLMFAHIGEINMKSMLEGMPVAFLLISLLLVFSLRSWKLGVLSLLPNIVPALIGFGIWGLVSGEINLGLAVVASMSLGIIVDDTVHFLSKYRHARVDEGLDAVEAVRYAFASVGRALWVTTVVLAVGFAVLTLSSFRLNSDMGLLTGIIIVTALAVDFLFLPAILIMFDKSTSAPARPTGTPTTTELTHTKGETHRAKDTAELV